MACDIKVCMASAGLWLSCVAACNNDLTNMNKYKGRLTEMVAESYNGTISDRGHPESIPCRFDKKAFQITFDKASASEMQCHDPEQGAKTVDCKEASSAWFGIRGALMVEGETPASIELQIIAVYDDHCREPCHNDYSLSVEWQIVFANDELYDIYGGFEQLGDIQQLGDTLENLYVSINHGGENDHSVWESCHYAID